MWAVNQWWKRGAEGVGELYRVRKERETKGGKEEDKGGQAAEQDGGKRKQVQESKRQREGRREGGRVVLDSPPLGLISFCIPCCEPAG